MEQKKVLRFLKLTPDLEAVTSGPDVNADVIEEIRAHLRLNSDANDHFANSAGEPCHIKRILEMEGHRKTMVPSPKKKKKLLSQSG